MLRYEIILVATDLSDPSMAAVRHAAALTRAVNGRLILSYVMENRLPAAVIGLTKTSVF
jgi:nucleotide-binding universal stress UspA family protein